MKKISWKMILCMQAAVMIYTLSTVAAKLAAMQDGVTLEFFLFYGLEIAVLGVYAILWQQIIKRCELSIAYANRSTAIFWSLLWPVLFFGEKITVTNLIGVIIVFAGTMIVNSDDK